MGIYVAERKDDGRYIGFENKKGDKTYTFFDKNGNILKTDDGLEYVFKSVGINSCGWRTVEVNDHLKGYLTPDWGLYLFECKNVSEVEFGFGKIEKRDGKFYLFNTDTEKLETVGYEDAFVLSPHTRVVGSDSDGFKILFNKVSLERNVRKLTDKVYPNCQDAIFDALDFELTLKTKAPRKKSARIMPSIIKYAPNDGHENDDDGHTV